MRVLDLFALLAFASCHSQPSNVAAATGSGGAGAVGHPHDGIVQANAEEKHPVRGVIVSVLASEQSLLVSHEDIPSVMAAMTMAFKTDAGTLAKAKKGQKISGHIVRKADDWWLTDVIILTEP